MPLCNAHYALCQTRFRINTIIMIKIIIICDKIDGDDDECQRQIILFAYSLNLQFLLVNIIISIYILNIFVWHIVRKSEIKYTQLHTFRVVSPLNMLYVIMRLRLLRCRALIVRVHRCSCLTIACAISTFE